MASEKSLLITETALYRGFGRFHRSLLTRWKDYIVEIGDPSTTLSTTADLNQRLRSDNAVIFFDHHYAFDAIPVALILGQLLKQVAYALIPYAVHLDMGVHPTGRPSLRYRIRTRAFHWLIKNIQKANPNIRILSVVREFELNNPRLKAIVDAQFSGANTRYLKSFHQLFTQYQAGLISILSPMAGIAFPDRPALNPQIYRLMEIVQRRRANPLAFYLVSAYPRLQAQYHYLAPLLTRHRFVARGPFYLPSGNYDQAQTELAGQLHHLRRAADFSPPDYSRIQHK